MEVGAKRDNSREAAFTTRVYAPTRGSSAYAYSAQPAVAPKPEPPAPKPQTVARPLPVPFSKTRHLTAGVKITMIACVLLTAVLTLNVIARYENIAAQYAIVNQLKTDIQDTELRLAELNVGLERQVDMDMAKSAAVRMGMTYPSASQYVRAGDPLPIHSTAISTAYTGEPAE